MAAKHIKGGKKLKAFLSKAKAAKGRGADGGGLLLHRQISRRHTRYQRGGLE